MVMIKFQHFAQHLSSLNSLPDETLVFSHWFSMHDNLASSLENTISYCTCKSSCQTSYNAEALSNTNLNPQTPISFADSLIAWHQEQVAVSTCIPHT